MPPGVWPASWTSSYSCLFFKSRLGVSTSIAPLPVTVSLVPMDRPPVLPDLLGHALWRLISDFTNVQANPMLNYSRAFRLRPNLHGLDLSCMNFLEFQMFPESEAAGSQHLGPVLTVFGSGGPTRCRPSEHARFNSTA